MLFHYHYEDLNREFQVDLTFYDAINYYGRFYPSAMHTILCHIDWRLARWATSKYKKLRGRQQEASRWLKQIAKWLNDSTG